MRKLSYRSWLFMFAVSLPVMTTAAETRVQDIAGKDAPPGAVWLDTQDLSSVSTGWGNVGAGQATAGHPISINKQGFVHGIGTHAVSMVNVNLKKTATRFVAGTTRSVSRVRWSSRCGLTMSRRPIPD